jgi:alpha-L-arabinofuranosidase
MAVKIPEFILSGMFVKGSLAATESGFCFCLKNTYAPGTVEGFGLEVDGNAVPPSDLSLRVETDAEPRPVPTITANEPYPLPVDTLLEVSVNRPLPETGDLRLHVTTREVGILSFSVSTEDAGSRTERWPKRAVLKRLFSRPLAASVVIDGDDEIGEISPEIYGHFVEHLERCVYCGIWDDRGELNHDVVALVREMAPPVIRYPGGNFASDYHWEEGVGPPEQRPEHYDRAWHVTDSNQVGTDEFLRFCAEVGSAPCLVVNDGSGTPDEAARWVEYCNGSVDTPMGARRAANGHPEPYGVRLWGLGNEVWGEWQIGHTDAESYVKRIIAFIDAMRAVDPEIRLVAVGLDHLENDPRNAAAWNATVLRGIGDRIDYISFHVYQPSEEGYRPYYDPETLYRQIVSAPLDVEAAIGRLHEQIVEICGEGCVSIALDEWNVKLPPAKGARTMHEQQYTVRDSLHVAGMLNVFHRSCRALRMANLAMLVNVLPAIVKPQDGPAEYTPIAYPFMLYATMERLALACRISGDGFDVPHLGLNIVEKTNVSWLDATATKNADGSRVVAALVNKHPTRRMKCRVSLTGFPELRTVSCRRLQGSAPLAQSAEIRDAGMPRMRGEDMMLTLPPASVTVVALHKE